MYVTRLYDNDNENCLGHWGTTQLVPNSMHFLRYLVHRFLGGNNATLHYIQFWKVRSKKAILNLLLFLLAGFILIRNKFSGRSIFLRPLCFTILGLYLTSGDTDRWISVCWIMRLRRLILIELILSEWNLILFWYKISWISSGLFLDIFEVKVILIFICYLNNLN